MGSGSLPENRGKLAVTQAGGAREIEARGIMVALRSGNEGAKAMIAGRRATQELREIV